MARSAEPSESSEPAAPTSGGRRQISVRGHEAHTHTLSTGWAACTPADEHIEELADLDRLSWIPTRVPGTAADALREAGLWQVGEPYDFDAQDWWFRTSFDAGPAAPGEEVVLRLDGIATVSEVYLNGERVLHSDSMFAAHALDVGRLLRAGDHEGVKPAANPNELVIRCRALGPLLAETRRPRARWRTRLVPERNLRFFRTMLLGRAPGFAPGPAVVGPWRGVFLERHREVAVHELKLRSRVEGEDGVLSVTARLRPLGGARVETVTVELDGPNGRYRAQLALSGPADAATAQGELIVPAVERWWPHTHGEPVLHGVRLLVEVTSQDAAMETTREYTSAKATREDATSAASARENAANGTAQPGAERTRIEVDAGRVGFRELTFGAGTDHDVLREGIDLHVNGVRVFARGALWTPIDPVGMAPSYEELRAALTQAREAGMNMLRLPGAGAYETSAFYDLCDELGMLVWQDFMFANFDYPLAYEPFRESVTREAVEVLDALGGRPSLTVLCGNSEVEQQVAMLGLDPAMGRDELFGELLPDLVRESGVDAVYVPSAPCGGELPFRPNRGIANYYGVGGYRRPLEDARRAGVRFAAECLAFSNVPSGEYPAETGVPQDEGTDWDFKDVRDHYLKLLFDLDPAALEREDRERYLELARAATGEVMAEVLGEWRRAGSPCGGGMVLWLRDLLPGAGWGLIDSTGTPKVAYHHFKRACAPVAVWTIDEGLGGVVVHVANDRPVPLSATLRVALYRGGEVLIEQAQAPVELGPHSQDEWNVETVIGHFADASWAYRFGPPAQDAIVVSVEREGSGATDTEIICQAVRFPAGRPLHREGPEELGLAARSTPLPSGEIALAVHSAKLAYGVRIDAPGLRPSDDGFFIEPGGTHSLTLRPSGPDVALGSVRVVALNMEDSLYVELASQAVPA